MGSLGRLCVASAAATLGLTAAATAAQPAAGFVQKHTKGDTAAAQRASLTLADLGAGWSAPGTQTAPVASLDCPGSHPHLSGVTETGASASVTFQEGAQGPFASGSTWIYKTGPQAVIVWQRAVGKRLLECLARTVTASSSKVVKFTVESRRVLRAPRGGMAAYRVVATAETSGRSVPAYYDIVLVTRGRGIAELSFARVGAPVAARLESALASAVARRLPGAK